MKICRRCGREQQESNFYKTHRGGRQSTCKRCVLARARDRYAADPETFKGRVDQRRLAIAAGEWTRHAHVGPKPYNSAIERARYLRRTYGMGSAEFDALLERQGGCAICGASDPGRYWCVDHDHLSGTVRGILCWHCNVGLGHFRDDALSLLTAIDYLMARAEVAA